jgi:hypothetical protein
VVLLWDWYVQPQPQAASFTPLHHLHRPNCLVSTAQRGSAITLNASKWRPVAHRLLKTSALGLSLSICSSLFGSPPRYQHSQAKYDKYCPASGVSGPKLYICRYSKEYLDTSCYVCTTQTAIRTLQVIYCRSRFLPSHGKQLRIALQTSRTGLRLFLGFAPDNVSSLSNKADVFSPSAVDLTLHNVEILPV